MEIVKGDKKERKNRNKYNRTLFIIFFITLLLLHKIYYSCFIGVTSHLKVAQKGFHKCIFLSIEQHDYKHGNIIDF